MSGKTLEQLLERMDEKIDGIVSTIKEVKNELKDIDKKLDVTTKDTTENKSEINHLISDFSEFKRSHSEQKDRIWTGIREAEKKAVETSVQKLQNWVYGSVIIALFSLIGFVTSFLYR